MKISSINLPASAVTETFGLLACRGAGKSNAARVMAEAFFKEGLPFVAVDPVGSWWGLRSSRDGRGPGLPIPIFGGKHGDVPLEREGGELVADLIVEHRLSCVLDLTTFESESSKKKFLLDFARRLYLKNEEPLHLFLEESDDYIPQRPMRDEAQLLRAWENIVRRGRARGLGMTMITQRSASINKSVLTQVQTLITLRTTGPQDRAAIEAWLKYNDQSPKILAELPKLANGEAWVWSPNFLKDTKKIQFPLSHTFDSGATPTGTKRASATLADVDLKAIEKRMAATVEKAKADDPKALRKRVAELEHELKSSSRKDDSQDLRRQLDDVEQLLKLAHSLQDCLTNQRNALCKKTNEKTQPVRPPLQEPPVKNPWKPGFELKAMHRAMLTSLAQHPDGLTKRQILIHTGYAASGPVSTAFADLTRSGYVEGAGNRLAITDAGLRALGPFEPLPVGDALREWLLTGSKLSTMEKALLRVICRAYPNAIQKGKVLEQAEYAASGPVSSAFAKLVAYGYALPQGSAMLKAAEELFS